MLTAGEGQLNLLVEDLHGNEVVLLVEPAVVEEQSVSLPGGESARKQTRDKRRAEAILQATLNLSLTNV